MVDAGPVLCEYCSNIDFDLLDHPSQSDFSDLVVHKAVPRRDLQRTAPGRSFSDWGWSLGLQSRIDEQAATCPMCHAIVQILCQNEHVKAPWIANDEPVCIVKVEGCGQVRALEERHGSSPTDGSVLELKSVSLFWQPNNEKNIGPGIVEYFEKDFEDTGLEVPKLVECLRACSPGTLSRPPPDDIFVEDVERTDELAFGGRKVPELINSTLAKTWLMDCLENHSDSCGMYHATALEGQLAADIERCITLFRLIDVKSKVIVEFENIQLSSLKFTALSYVWGGPQSVTSCKETYPDMLYPGALERGKIPRTISDAIHFTASLDVPFLWVDSLCILQDDELDKTAQISHMSDVYRHALFTIVAAEGHNADAGLPGVTMPRTARQFEVPLPQGDSVAHKNLLTTLSPRKEFYMPPTDMCTWGRRGWTLQEHALSRRCIFFMDHQILWHCHQSRWLEEVHSETRLAKVNWASMMEVSMVTKLEDKTDLWRTFEVLIRNFKLRTLTHEGDAYDAFSGILAEMKRRTGESFLWGMPVSTFEHALCWKPYSPYTPARRSSLTTREVTTLGKRVSFPSWSWLGWGGHHEAITLASNDVVPNFTAYILRNSPLRLERISKLEGTEYDQNLSFSDITTEMPRLTLSRLKIVPDDQFLCFRAEIISFGMVGSRSLEHVKGAISRTKFWPSENSAMLVSELLKYESNGFVPGQDMFGPLPAAGYRILIDAETHDEVGRTKPCRWKAETGPFQLVRIATEAQPRKENETTLIFLEVEKTTGVSQRTAIGKILEKAWDQADPQTRVVVLN